MGTLEHLEEIKAEYNLCINDPQKYQAKVVAWYSTSNNWNKVILARNKANVLLSLKKSVEDSFVLDHLRSLLLHKS